MTSSSNVHPAKSFFTPLRRMHPGRAALILAGLMSIILALCFPMAHTAPMDILPAQRDTKITLAAGQTLTQTFDAPAPFSQVSLLPGGLAKAKSLTLDITIKRGESMVTAASLPLSKVKNNARIKLDLPLQPAGTYTLVLAAVGTGEVRLSGSAAASTLDGMAQEIAPGIRVLRTVGLYGTFPLYLGCLLLLISLTPLRHVPHGLSQVRRLPENHRGHWLMMLTILSGAGMALLLSAHPEWLGIQWMYPQLLDGDVAAVVSLFGTNFHAPLFTMVLATWVTAGAVVQQLAKGEIALHRVVLIMIIGCGILMGLCRPMLFEVGFDEGQHRQIMDQFAGEDPFTFAEGLYFSSSWNVGLIFHTLGRGLGTLLGLSAPWGYRLGGLFSLAAYAAMASAAVNIMPRYKAAAALFALWPTNVFLAVTTTYDSLIIGGVLLGTAMVFRELHHREHPLSPGTALGLLALLALCTLSKSAYSPLILMLLMLPREKFACRKSRILFRALVILLALTCTLGRVVESAVVLSDGDAGADIPRNLTAAQSRSIFLSGDDRMDGTSTADQLHALKSNPITGFTAMGKLLFQTLPQQSIQMAAAYGYFGGDSIAIWLWLGLLLLGPMMQQDASPICLRRRLMLLLLSLLPLLVLGGIMHLTNTPPGSTDIVGIQPRYILPLVPLIAPALAHPFRLPEKASRWITRMAVGLTGFLLVHQSWLHLFLPFYT